MEYIVRYNYISKEICINKDKKELKCNGKCHLIKELGKISQDENPLSDNSKKTDFNYKIELIFLDKTQFGIGFLYAKINKAENSYSDLYSYLYLCDILNPPESKIL